MMTNPRAMTKSREQRQRGTVSVELAFILLFTFLILPVSFLFVRVFLQYAVIKEGTRDAAMYMATLPPAALINDAERARHVGVAENMVREAIQSAGLATLTDLEGGHVTCDTYACGSTLPQNLVVDFTISLDGTLFSGFTADFTDTSTLTWQISARSVAPLATAEFKLP